MADVAGTRADYVELAAQNGGERLMPIYGPAANVIQRFLQLMAGLQDTSSVTLQFDRTVRAMGLVFDATKAPFRVVGRAWSMGFNVAASPAVNNILNLINRTAQSGLADPPILVTVDEVRYQGPSAALLKTGWTNSSPPVGGSGNISGQDIESPVTKQDLATAGGVKRIWQTPIANATTNAGDLFPNLAPFATLANITVGNPPDVLRPDALVLFPQEFLYLFQVTVNVVLTATLSGKVWTFPQGAVA